MENQLITRKQYQQNKLGKNTKNYQVVSQPMHPSSGDSLEGVMTSIFIAANIVYTQKTSSVTRPYISLHI